MKILFNDEAADGKRLPEALEKMDVFERAASECICREGLNPQGMEISLSLVSKEEIRALNREYRNVDNYTDVLSFPLIEDFNAPEAERRRETCEIPLGDVVICLEQAEGQAREYGHSPEREIVYLFVHSILHLLGYDHMEEEDKLEMRKREEEVMSFLDLERR